MPKAFSSVRLLMKYFVEAGENKDDLSMALQIYGAFSFKRIFFFFF